MKKLLALLAVATLTGCQSFTYEQAGTKIKRSSLLFKTSISSLEVTANTNGVPTVKLKGYASDAQAAADALNTTTDLLNRLSDRLVPAVVP